MQLFKSLFIIFVLSSGLLYGFELPSSATSSISSFGSSANNLSNVNMGSLLTESNYQSVVNKYQGNMLNNIYKSFAGSTGGGINAIGGSNLLGLCYVYKGTGSSDFSLNVCDLVGKLSNPCSFAPSLTSFGYSKKSTSSSEYSSLKNYCQALFGTSTKKKMTLKTIDTNSYISSRATNASTTSSNGGNVLSGSGASGAIHTSAISFNNAKTTTNSGGFAYKAIMENDYENYEVLKQINANNPSAYGVDGYDINVDYEKYDDYEASIDELADIYFNMEKALDPYEIYTIASQQFLRINANSSDYSSRSTNKENAKAKILTDFDTMIEKWKVTEYDKRFSMIDKTGWIVYPTKELIARFNEKDRLRLIAKVEKQKRVISSLKAQIQYEALQKRNEIDIQVSNALVRSREFDRTTATSELKTLLSGVTTSSTN